jgi:hypothetical protein
MRSGGVCPAFGGISALLQHKSQQIFVTAILAFDAGKAVVQIAAIQITVEHLFDIRPPEAILPCEKLI